MFKKYRISCDGTILVTPLTKSRAFKVRDTMRKLSPSITWKVVKA